MSSTANVGAPGYGYTPEVNDQIMIAPASAVAVGDIMAINFATVAGSGDGARWTTTKVPVAADIQTASDVDTTGIFCVALTACVSGGTFVARFRGYCMAIVNGVGIALGDHLMADTNRDLVETAGTGTSTITKSIAIAMEAGTAAAVLRPVYFNGVEGVGVSSSVS